MKAILYACLIAFFSLSQWSAAKSQSLQVLPVEAFSQLPDVQNVVLSPDGEKVASAVRVDLPGQKGISVQLTELKTGKSKILLFSDNSKYVIYRLQWKDNLTLLAHGFAAEELEYRGSSNMYDVKARITRVLFVNTKTGEVTKPFTNTFLNNYRYPPTSLNHVVDLLRDDPDHVLIAVYGTVFKVNIHHGGSSPLSSQPKHFAATYIDRQHRPRAGFHFDDKVATVKYLDLKDNKWKDLARYEGYFSEDDVDILGFDQDPNVVYTREYLNDKKAVFKVDLSADTPKKELVFQSEDFDIDGYLEYSFAQKKTIGILSSDATKSMFFDPDLERLKTKIIAVLPEGQSQFYSFSDDLNKFLVFSTGPKESGTYYLVTRSPLKVEAIAYRYKSLTPDTLSPVEVVKYKARDGMEIEAFLTLPKGKKAKNLPTIMLPHGGPIHRDSNAFDYWAQFFANKGYAVLQMNFRGSTGYGYTHRQAGLQKWGKEMQDDVEDGARFLIDKGITNPKKICIVGASYGGYAALMGVVKTPKFYQCAISVAGVSDVRELVLDNRAFWRTYNVVDEQIGTGAKFLKDISPVNHVKKIRVPVLLIHGELDRQVEIKHSKKMHKALKKAKKKVEFVELPNEDHYLTYEDNRILTFKKMADFLDKYMPTE